MKNHLLRILIFLGSWFFWSCAGVIGMPKPQEAPKDLEQGSAAIKAKGDSAATLEVMLQEMDTARVDSSFASELYLVTLKNFIELAPEDPRTPDIRLWKANHYYNLGQFEESIEAYKSIIENHPDHHNIQEAKKMIAQAYSLSGNEDKSNQWYKTLLAEGDDNTRKEARNRLAQSIYVKAENFRKNKEYEKAANFYRKTALEYPTSAIASTSLYNAGIMMEKAKKWMEAIDMYHMFFDAYMDSKMVLQALFREAKCWEKAGYWKKAAEKYVSIAKKYAGNKEAEMSLYNAGFAYENAKLPHEAAKTFERYAKTYPVLKDAPNALFHAAEIYGQLKKWEKVSELQSMFARRYANDPERRIQALCLAGVAEFEQGKNKQAKAAMLRALQEYFSLSSPGPNSRYYAAQSSYTLARISFRKMSRVKLPPNSSQFNRNLQLKTSLLKETITDFAAVMDFKIIEWAVKSSFAMGKAFEKYGFDIFNRYEKHFVTNLEEQEQAVQALSASYQKASEQYTQVLDLAMEHSINNPLVREAGERLVKLSFQAAQVNSKIVSNLSEMLSSEGGNGSFSVLLSQIQQVAPYRQKALEFYRILLEVERNFGVDFPESKTIPDKLLQTSLKAGRDYLQIAEIARSAPIPKDFLPYEVLLYKVKLLGEGVAEFELKGMDALLKGLNTATQFGIESKLIDSLGYELGKALYIRSRSHDITAFHALHNPPLPSGIPEEQRKEYTSRFEKMGFQLREQAVEGYKRIVEQSKKEKIPHKWGELAFARLFLLNPVELSQKVTIDTVLHFSVGPQWKATGKKPDSLWREDFHEQWPVVKKSYAGSGSSDKGESKVFFWAGERQTDGDFGPFPKIWAQREIQLPQKIKNIWVKAKGNTVWNLYSPMDTLLHSGMEGDTIDIISRNVTEFFNGRENEVILLSATADNTHSTEKPGLWINP